MINVKDCTPYWFKEKDDLSSPISDQIFGFCNPQLSQETIQTPEVTSSSNGCYEDNTSYGSNISFSQNGDTNTYQENNFTTPAAAITTSTITTGTNAINDNGNLPILLDSPQEIENDFSASMNFSTSPQFLAPPYLVGQQDDFDLSSIPPACPAIDIVQGMPQYNINPVIPPTLPSVYGEDFLSSVSCFLPLNSSNPPHSFLGPAMGTYHSQNINTSLSIDSGIFASNLLTGPELIPLKLKNPGGNNMMFCPDSMPQVFTPPELQVLRTENQPMAGGATDTTSLASGITSLDDPTPKVGRLTVEEKKDKINRYRKKRNERNFSKKIKYACRKTLADSRPRVRGRFAKNDDYGETQTSFSGNQEDVFYDIEDSQSSELVYY